MQDFQSYLILGSTKDAREETQKIAKQLLIDIEKPSQDVSIIKAPKKSIQINQIRELKKHIYQKPLKYKNKFIVIENAQKLTTEAQNALLKILEEPPTHAIIVLEAPNKESILQTILSRVVLVRANISPFTQEAKILNGIRLLESLGEIEDPEEFLDDQILALTEILIKKTKGKNVGFSQKNLIETIEKCRAAKSQIASNVNPTFALTNLIFSLDLNEQIKN